MPQAPGDRHERAALAERSRGQQPGEQQTESAPAENLPEALGSSITGTEGKRQGIEQTLGDAQPLLSSTLPAAAARPGGCQAMHQADGLQQSRPFWTSDARARSRARSLARVSAHDARMEPPTVFRPVEQVAPSSAAHRQQWPESAAEQAEALQRLLAISDRDWHAHKSQPSRRAAELLAGALVQLLQGDGPGATSESKARERAITLTSTALGWLNGELRDPGCPQHRR